MVVDDDRRPWAEVFDLILSEYPGYTDDTILDLTLERINQMVDVIVKRKIRDEKNRLRYEADLAEAQVRSLGAILLNLSQSRQAAASMARVIESVRFTMDGDKPKEKELPSTARVARFFGIRPDGLVGVRQ